jgi:hypothetical protein
VPEPSEHQGEHVEPAEAMLNVAGYYSAVLVVVLPGLVLLALPLLAVSPIRHAMMRIKIATLVHCIAAIALGFIVVESSSQVFARQFLKRRFQGLATSSQVIFSASQRSVRVTDRARITRFVAMIVDSPSVHLPYVLPRGQIHFTFTGAQETYSLAATNHKDVFLLIAYTPGGTAVVLKTFGSIEIQRWLRNVLAVTVSS